VAITRLASRIGFWHNAISGRGQCFAALRDPNAYAKKIIRFTEQEIPAAGIL
jgi:hypothetical protein